MVRDPFWYLEQVEKIELANRDKRVVHVWMPCELPKYLWNVDNAQYVGRSPLDGETIPHMRKGIMGNFRIDQGSFSVKFNDGSTLKF